MFIKLTIYSIQENTLYPVKQYVPQGSDTLYELSQNWAESFMDKNSEINIKVIGGDSSTRIEAFINKTADFANSSRKIKDFEIDKAKKVGLDPQEYIVAWDGIL